MHISCLIQSNFQHSYSCFSSWRFKWTPRLSPLFMFQLMALQMKVSHPYLCLNISWRFKWNRCAKVWRQNKHWWGFSFMWTAEMCLLQFVKLALLPNSLLQIGQIEWKMECFMGSGVPTEMKTLIYNEPPNSTCYPRLISGIFSPNLSN